MIQLSLRGLSRALLGLSLFVFVVGCSDGAGCDDVMTDLSGPINSNEYIQQGAVARVSSAGVSFLENNIPEIADELASSDCDAVWCPDNPGQNNDWATCDANGKCRTDTPGSAFIGVKIPPVMTGGQFTGHYDTHVCVVEYTDGTDWPTADFEDCNVYVYFDSIDIDPASSTGDLTISTTLTIWSTGIITYTDNFGPNIGSCTVTARDNNNGAIVKDITADLFFDNANPLDRLRIRPENVNITLTEDDVQLGNNCDLLGIIPLSWFKGLIFGALEDSIKEQLDGAVAGALESLLSESCEEAACSGGSLSYCDPDDVCRFNSDDTSVPLLLGMEGQIALDSLLGGFSGRAQDMGFSAFSNNGTTSGGGLNLELKAAAVSEESDCVPSINPPNINLPAFAPVGTDWHAAVGVSDELLNTIMYQAYSSGALCQSLGGIGALNSSAVGLLVPSLTELTGGTVPLTIDVLPRSLPELQIGSNITGPDPDDPEVTMLIEPLLTLVIDDLDLDIYAERNGALFRALTLRVDLAVDLSIEIGGDGELVLIAGDASRWLENVEVMNGDVLAEDSAEIEEAIPILMGIVLPLLTDSLEQSFAIPSISGFTLNLDQITGANSYGTTAYGNTRYAHLALYADLGFDPEGAASTPARAETVASLVDLSVPDVEGLRAGEKVRLELDVDALARADDAPPPVVWSRVDDGIWRPLVEGPTVIVKDPVLHREGTHVVEVAAARAGEPLSLDETPERIEFVVDAQPPELQLIPHGASGLEVIVTDTVSGPDELDVQVTIDGLPRGSLELDETGAAWVTANPEQHQIQIVAEDAFGRRIDATVGQLPVQRRQGEDTLSVAEAVQLDAPRGEPVSVAAGGCSSTQVTQAGAPLTSALALVILTAGLLRRRRR